MDYKDGLEGEKITGKDINGKDIEVGTILQVGKGFGVAIIKAGEDRLNTTTAFLDSIEIVVD